MYFYYWDWTYFLLVLPAFFFALWASARVGSIFRRYQTQYSARGLTGAQAARQVLDRNGLRHIPVERTPGELSDHYDPVSQVIRLSQSVYHGTSTAAIGVACHEAGHAVQYDQGYTPIRIRTAILPLTRIGSRLALPLILLGIVLGAGASVFHVMAYVGLALFALSTIFQLVTLPAEYNASNRALAAIQEGRLLNENELQGAKKVLSAAALTYVAALAVSMTQLLRFGLLLAPRRR